MSKKENTEKKDSYVSKSVLQGFRCIQNVDIDFYPGLNIIIGKNGSGKTNFLSFLDSALNLRFDDFYDFNSSIVITGEKQTEISAKRKKINPEVSINNERNIISTSDIEYSLKINNEPILLKEKSTEYDIFNNTDLTYQSNTIKHGMPKGIPIIETPFKWVIDKSGNVDIGFPLITDSSGSYFLRGVFATFLIESLYMGSQKSEWPDIEKKGKK